MGFSGRSHASGVGPLFHHAKHDFKHFLVPSGWSQRGAQFSARAARRSISWNIPASL
jgi:hypothetical protein